MTYGRQQLLRQNQVTVIRSIDFDSQIDEYHTAVAQFQHAICHRRCAKTAFCSDIILLCFIRCLQSVIL